MKDICRFDRGSLSGKATKTEEGYIKGNAVLTRTGVFLYRNSDGSIRRELRHPDDVFAADSLETLKMLPITNGHPEEKLVNSENADRLSIGSTGESVQIDGAHLLNSLVITHKDGIEATELGRKELSLGYNLDLEQVEGEYNGERYDHRQRNIRYNHLAIVDRARAGSAAALHLDAGDALQIDAGEQPPETKKEYRKMKTVTLDGIDYEAAPEVANALDKANSRADAAEAKLAETEKALETANADKSTLEAERDTFKEKAEAKNDAEEIQAAVKSRIALERVATKALDQEEAKDIANLDDGEIKLKVIAAKFPEANLDGKDEAYIQARFDIACEMIEAGHTAADQKAQIGEKRGDSKTTALDEKQNEGMDALKNMHKAKKEA